MEEKLAKYFAGELSVTEADEVEVWRSESNENAKTFYEAKVVFSNYINITPQKTIDELLEAGTIMEDKQQTKETKQVSFFTKGWIAVAASVSILMVIGIYIIQNWEDWSTVPTGLTSMVQLEDGSEVTLYKDAVIEEIEFSADKRSIKLEGKAYFDIKKDKNRPFTIYTSEAIVEVLGTSFVINAESELHATEVIVESGEVSIATNPESGYNLGTNVSLGKGEKGMISPNAKGIIKQNNRDANYLAWKNQLLTFKRDRMDNVASVLANVYGYNVVFANPSIKKCALTGQYKKKTPEEIANLIATTFGIQYEVKEKTITFSGEACN